MDEIGGFRFPDGVEVYVRVPPHWRARYAGPVVDCMGATLPLTAPRLTIWVPLSDNEADGIDVPVSHAEHSRLVALADTADSGVKRSEGFVEIESGQRVNDARDHGVVPPQVEHFDIDLTDLREAWLGKIRREIAKHNAPRPNSLQPVFIQVRIGEYRTQIKTRLGDRLRLHEILFGRRVRAPEARVVLPDVIEAASIVVGPDRLELGVAGGRWCPMPQPYWADCVRRLHRTGRLVERSDGYFDATRAASEGWLLLAEIEAAVEWVCSGFTNKTLRARTVPAWLTDGMPGDQLWQRCGGIAPPLDFGQRTGKRSSRDEAVLEAIALCEYLRDYEKLSLRDALDRAQSVYGKFICGLSDITYDQVRNALKPDRPTRLPESITKPPEKPHQKQPRRR